MIFSLFFQSSLFFIFSENKCSFANKSRERITDVTIKNLLSLNWIVIIYLEMIGKEETINRLKNAIDRL